MGILCGCRVLPVVEYGGGPRQASQNTTKIKQNTTIVIDGYTVQNFKNSLNRLCTVPNSWEKSNLVDRYSRLIKLCLPFICASEARLIQLMSQRMEKTRTRLIGVNEIEEEILLLFLLWFRLFYVGVCVFHWGRLQQEIFCSNFPSSATGVRLLSSCVMFLW